MTPIDGHSLASWHDFFVMVGGGAAALTGLVFVAMSLNLEGVIMDSTHRNRAVGTLAGFSAVFILSGLALMGEPNPLMLGVEWLVISTIGAFIYVNGYVQAVRSGETGALPSLIRTIFGTLCYLAQIVGSVLLMIGHQIGIYIAGTAMMVFFASLISGAWLLLVGICSEKKTKTTKQ